MNEEIVLRKLREMHAQGRTIIMVTHDPVVARLADRRLELHHGKIAAQEIFSLSDEEQFDEVLEELWVLAENGEPAELGRVEVEGALPMRLALERMKSLGLVDLTEHALEPHTHKQVLNRCHVAFRPASEYTGHGDHMIIFTEKGRKRAEDVIRRHRLAERLFTQTFHVHDEKEIAEEACKFEHILSPEATERICSFLGHPRTCPHGSPIPAGECCLAAKTAAQQSAVSSQKSAFSYQHSSNQRTEDFTAKDQRPQRNARTSRPMPILLSSGHYSSPNVPLRCALCGNIFEEN